MARRVDGYLSDTGKIFKTEAEAVEDETREWRLKKLEQFFYEAHRLAYTDTAFAFASYACDRRMDLLNILSPATISKPQEDNP
jgi:hypothetical protein